MGFNRVQKYQFTIGIVMTLLIIVVIEFISISRVSKVINDIPILTNSLIPCIEITDNILDYYNRVGNAISNLLITSNYNELNSNKEYIKKTRIELQREFDKLENTKGVMNKFLFFKIKDDYQKIRKLEDKIIELGLERRISEADKLLTTDLRNIQNKFFNEIQSFIDFQVGAANDWRDRMVKENNRNYYLMLMLSIITLLLIMSLIFSLFLRQKRIRLEREALSAELDKALEKNNVFTRLLTICDECQKIRDNNGRWHSVETLLTEHPKIECSHCLCPECAKRLFPAQ